VDTVEKLTTLLRNRYGGSGQIDKHRMELRLRRRQPGESLAHRHHDVRRPMALAHPTLRREDREAIAVDYFVDALNDPEFALKVRERAPSTHDEALRVAQQLEAWTLAMRRQKVSAETSSTKVKARRTVGADDDCDARIDDIVAKVTSRVMEKISKHPNPRTAWEVRVLSQRLRGREAVIRVRVVCLSMKDNLPTLFVGNVGK